MITLKRVLSVFLCAVITVSCLLCVPTKAEASIVGFGIVATAALSLLALCGIYFSAEADTTALNSVLEDFASEPAVAAVVAAIDNNALSFGMTAAQLSAVAAVAAAFFTGGSVSVGGAAGAVVNNLSINPLAAPTSSTYGYTLFVGDDSNGYSGGFSFAQGSTNTASFSYNFTLNDGRYRSATVTVGYDSYSSTITGNGIEPYTVTNVFGTSTAGTLLVDGVRYRNYYGYFRRASGGLTYLGVCLYASGNFGSLNIGQIALSTNSYADTNSNLNNCSPCYGQAGTSATAEGLGNDVLPYEQKEQAGISSLEAMIGAQSAAQSGTATGAVDFPIVDSIPASLSDVLTSEQTAILDGVDDLPDYTTSDTANDFRAPLIILQKFPFCIPWDLYYSVKSLVRPPVDPVWTIPLNLHFDFFGFETNFSYDFVIDMTGYSTVFSIARWFFTLIFTLGLILLSRDIIRG